MTIREVHTHDDKICYEVRRPSVLKGEYARTGLFAFGTRLLTGGFVGYTGHWYFYDPKSGKQVASIHDRLNSDMVETMRIANLEEDPDCR